MSLRSQLRYWSLVLTSAVAACSTGSDAVGPSKEPPARISAISELSRSAAVGSVVPGGLVVQVGDAAGRPVANVTVALAVTLGNGSTNPRLAVTDSKGQATAEWTLGTVLGANEVTASVNGVAAQIKFLGTGTPGPVNTITISPQNPRLLSGVDSTRLTVQSLDAFGNVTTPAPTLTPRDPTLISVAANGVVRALRRGGSTYVVATSGVKTDSVLVTVLATGQSLCTGAATPIQLAVGQVVTDVSGQGVCVHSSTAGAEYALVPFYNSGVPSASIPIEARGLGVSPLGLPLASIMAASAIRAPAPYPGLGADGAFEIRMRNRERSEGTSRIAAARAAHRASRSNLSPATAMATTVPVIGDLMKLNVNSLDYCANPDLRTGRVAAITDKAIVVADTANPAGGFTDAEYQSIGVTFDTLVDPVDRAAFGAPSDIDNNGRVIIFFSRAVNEKTSSGSPEGVVLGFFYNRDLLPKFTPPASSCPGSNVAEAMFLLVPDTGGVINGNRRSKSQVVTWANGTVSHEYEHMINAGRRLYVNNVGESWEAVWLDEGLAHVAEELNFWKASGKSPRSNLGASIYSDSKAAPAYSTFEMNNFLRYQVFLAQTEKQSPIGFNDFDSDLPTRGAIWNFLRYAADHQPAGQENAFWFKLVNSTTSGIANLTDALGGSPYAMLRDWAISVFMDDNPANVDARFQQPSWNLRSALTNGGTGVPFQLLTRTLVDNTPSSTILGGNGVSFFRFSVANNEDALLTVTTGGQPLPSTVQLAVVRVK